MFSEEGSNRSYLSFKLKNNVKVCIFKFFALLTGGLCDLGMHWNSEGPRFAAVSFGRAG